MRQQLWEDPWVNLVRDQLPWRPQRVEPRALKRRPKPSKNEHPVLAWMFRAQELCAQATRAAAPLKIKDVKVIATSPARQRWVFIKVLTSEDGLYGLGSANCAYLSWAVKAALEKHMVPFWIGKEVDRIEDLWQANHVCVPIGEMAR